MSSQIKKFIVKSDLTTFMLSAKNYNDAIQELYDKGFVNCGKVRLLEVVYQEISCTPHIINTDYRL